MNKKDLRIVFMGTPEFAVASLDALVSGGYNIVGVVCMADVPAGRGHKLLQCPVKQYAIEHNLPVLQTEKLKDPVFIDKLKSLNADLQIVVAFRMLPEIVWQMPRFGTFNLHGSLLPQYRGAAPINWAIINGDKQTGCTTFFLKHEIDTGDMILSRSIDIGDDETFGSVYERLMVLGAKMVTDTVDRILQGDMSATPQPQIPENELRPAPKLTKENTEINFNQTTSAVHNFVRGLSPHPTAWTCLEINNIQQIVKVFAVKPVISDLYKGEPCGSVHIEKKFLRITTTDGYVELLDIQLPNKKRMLISDALNGLIRN